MAAEYHLSNDHFSALCACESCLFLKEHADSPASRYFIPAGKVQPNEWVRLTHKARNYTVVCVKLCLQPVPCVLWTVYPNLCHHQQSPLPAHLPASTSQGNPKPLRESKHLLRTLLETKVLTRNLWGSLACHHRRTPLGSWLNLS